MSYGINFDLDLRFNSETAGTKPLLLRPLPHGVSPNKYNYKTFAFRKAKNLWFDFATNETASQLLFSRDVTGYNVYDPFINTPSLLISATVTPSPVPSPHRSDAGFRKPGPCKFRLILGGKVGPPIIRSDIGPITNSVNHSIFNQTMNYTSSSLDTYNEAAFIKDIDSLYDYFIKMNANDIYYYFAEIDFKNQVLSLGKQGLNQKITIYTTTSILGDRFGTLYFTLYDTNNETIPQNSAMTLAAKFVGQKNPGSPKILEHTVTSPGGITPLDGLRTYSVNNSAGSFGIYYINAGATVSDLSVAQRSQNDRFVTCKPGIKSFHISSTFAATPDNITSNHYMITHINNVIKEVNNIYSPFNISFYNISAVSKTGLLTTNNNPWSYAPQVVDTSTFGYSWPKNISKWCGECTENLAASTTCAVAQGCGHQPGQRGWVSPESTTNVSYDAIVLAHELGHNFGAGHVGGHYLMTSGKRSTTIDVGTFNIIESGIAMRAGKFSSPAVSGYIAPTPLTPVGIENVVSLRFDTNLKPPPGGLITYSAVLNLGQSFVLAVDVTPLNGFGNPVNNTTERYLAGECRRKLNCYTWQMQRGNSGVWKTIATGSKSVLLTFDLASGDTKNSYRCIVDVGGVQATSNTGVIVRGDFDAYTIVTSPNHIFKYSNNRSVDITELSEDVLKLMVGVDEYYPGTLGASFSPLVHISPNDSPVSVNKTVFHPLHPAKTFNSGKSYRIRSLLPFESFIPYTINFPTSAVVGFGAGNINANPFENSVTASGYPIYNIDSSWTANISGSPSIINMDKQMIIPITGINNINNVDHISYINSAGETLFWRDNDELSTLESLEYQQTYTVQSKDNTVPYILSYEIT